MDIGSWVNMNSYLYAGKTLAIQRLWKYLLQQTINTVS